MSDVVKNSKTISFLSFALTPILIIGFYLLVIWYERSSFNTYLFISNSLDTTQNIDYKIRTILDIYNGNLITILIMPIFFAAGISAFANYVFFKRIAYLETELKEIKEKLND